MGVTSGSPVVFYPSITIASGSTTGSTSLSAATSYYLLDETCTNTDFSISGGTGVIVTPPHIYNCNFVDVTPTPTQTTTVTPTDGISQARIDFIRNKFDQIAAIQPEIIREPGQGVVGTMGTNVEVTKKGDGVNLYVRGANNNVVSLDLTMDEAKALDLDPTGQSVRGMFRQLQDTMRIPVDAVNDKFVSYLQTRAETPAPTPTE